MQSKMQQFLKPCFQTRRVKEMRWWHFVKVRPKLVWNSDLFFWRAKKSASLGDNRSWLNDVINHAKWMEEKNIRVKLYRVSNKLNFDLIFSTRRSSESVRTFHTLKEISSNNSDTATIASSHWNMLDYHYPLCVWVSPQKKKKSSLIRFAHRKGVK